MLWHFNGRSGTIILQRTELSPGGTYQTSDVVNLANLGFTSLEYGSWEDFSEDDRYVSLHGTRNGGLVAAVLDVTNGQIVAEVGIQEADWVAVSPSGDYFAVQYLPRGVGPLRVDGGGAHVDLHAGEPERRHGGRRRDREAAEQRADPRLPEIAKRGGCRLPVGERGGFLDGHGQHA